MTIRQEMLEALRRCPKALRDSTKLVVDFLMNNLNCDGGFKGRGEQSDLYYTVFGLEALLALGAPLAKEESLEYLQKFTVNEPEDLIHLAGLIRCYANLSNESVEKELCEKFSQSIDKFRCTDGGYASDANAADGTVYGCFIALGAYQDLGMEPPDCAAVVKCINSLSVHGGGFANNKQTQAASTNATAAAITALHHLNQPTNDKSAEWLFAQCTSNGGFVAIPGLPMPDLLSTATALHALAITGFEIDTIKEKCLDFVDSLWCGKGGFCGSWADTTVDCEYTYYGLLALGHLGDDDGA